jgi:hypothetical protein
MKMDMKYGLTRFCVGVHHETEAPSVNTFFFGDPYGYLEKMPHKLVVLVHYF